MKICIHRFVLLLWLLAGISHAVEVDERARLHDEVPTILAEFNGAEERFTALMTKTGRPVPPAVTTIVMAHRATAQDWQRRINDPLQTFEVEKADQFNEELRTIQERLNHSADLMDQLNGSAERWPHSIQTIEMTRFRTFLQDGLDRGLNDAANGHIADDDEAQSRQQRRHELILTIIESQQTITERWAKVPPAAPELMEYQEHCRAVKAAMERAITVKVLNDERDIERDEAILELLDEIVQVVQFRMERLGDLHLAVDAPALIALNTQQDAERAALRALIAHQRIDLHDDAWNRTADHVRHVRDQRGLMTELVWEWIGLITDLPHLRQALNERMAEAPPALRTQTVAIWNELDVARATNETALAQALTAGDRIAATRARCELELTRRRYDLINEDLDFQMNQTKQDLSWRELATDPTVAAALKRLDAARASFLTARK